MKLKFLANIKYIIAVVIAFIITYLVIGQSAQLIMIRSSLNNIENQNQIVNQRMDQIVEVFGEEFNNIRREALFQTNNKDYMALIDELASSGSESNKEEKTDKPSDINQDEVQLAMFKYMGYLSESQEKDKKLASKKSLLELLKNNQDFISFLEGENLTLSELEENPDSVILKINTLENQNIITFYLSKEESLLFQKTPLEKIEIKDLDPNKFQENLKNDIKKNKTKLLSHIKNLEESKTSIINTINSEAVQAELQTKGAMIITEPTEKNLIAHYYINNKENESVGEINLDLVNLEISLIDLSNQKNKTIVTDLNSALSLFIKKLDTATFFEKKVTEARESIAKTIKDSGFQSNLKENNLIISEEPREDEDRIYYDIKTTEGVHISSIVIEKATGVVFKTDPDGTNSENLLFLKTEEQKKNLELPDEIPEYGDELTHEDGTFNLLIAGKHGNLMDTMIFAHINEKTQEIRMISVPRDLYFKGRKINSYGYFHGMSAFTDELSKITAYKLDKFILIDMYAFIDVVDLVGGIDITLKNAVIDPTYVTEDNGVWGTLHYEPGDYHLGGKEALRLARSRHTSSDFARAARQQLIIQALQNKAKTFGFGDLETFHKIVKVILAKTNTNIEFKEAISFYFKYKDYKIVSNDVISSGNILYVPPYVTKEQCAARVAAANATGEPSPGCEGENHAYTLLPRGNNWNIIKWYFKEKFEGELS